MDKFSFLNSVHPSYIAELYEKYLNNPTSQDPVWKSFFKGFNLESGFKDQQFFASQKPMDQEKFMVGVICPDESKNFKVVNLLMDIELEDTCLQKQIQFGS